MGVCAAHYSATTAAYVYSPAQNPAATCSFSHRERGERRPRRARFPGKQNVSQPERRLVFVLPITNIAPAA